MSSAHYWELLHLGVGWTGAAFGRRNEDGRFLNLLGLGLDTGGLEGGLCGRLGGGRSGWSGSWWRPQFRSSSGLVAVQESLDLQNHVLRELAVVQVELLDDGVGLQAVPQTSRPFIRELVPSEGQLRERAVHFQGLCERFHAVKADHAVAFVKNISLLQLGGRQTRLALEAAKVEDLEAPVDLEGLREGLRPGVADPVVVEVELPDGGVVRILGWVGQSVGGV
jgi:hypothetical protein